MNILLSVINQRKLKLNVSKTKLMIISNQKNINRDAIDIRINGAKLDTVNEIKYLGVIIDEKLKFDKNINYVARKMAKKTGVLQRIGRKLNMQQKIDIYKTTIETHLNYCASLLFLSTKTDINRLQVIQNKAMRCILRVRKEYPTKALLNTLEFLNCNQRITMNVIISMYKLVNDLWPQYLCMKITYMSENERKRTLRSKNEIEKIRATKTSTQNSIFYKGVEMYNQLPEEFRNEKTIMQFKCKIYEYIRMNNVIQMLT